MIRFVAIIKIALRALRRNKMRSLLTALGIIIGIGGVIATVAIGYGAKAMMEAQIASLGQNVILVFTGSTATGGVHGGWGSAGTLKIEDAEAIEREMRIVTAVSPEVRSYVQVAAGNQNWYTLILGESPEYFDIRQWPLAEGAVFTEQDVRSANKVAIIGKTVAEQLYGSASPIGQILRVKNVPFVIVGVLTSKGLSVTGSDQDDVVVTPYTSAMKRVMGVTTLRTINVQVADASLLDSGQKQVVDLLRQRHRIQPGRDDDFSVRGQQEIADAATAQSKTMTWLLGSAAAVALVVGGIGIMNIMLVSVTERTREIGIRMAVGARTRDVLLQFLTEAITLSSMGGLIGIAFGVVAARLISQFLHWPTLVPPPFVFLAFLVSAAIGIFFGFYPARKASKLDPIEALRYE